MNHINPSVYIPMRGPSELGASGKLQEVYFDGLVRFIRDVDSGDF
jgi:hypothetical protein